MDLLTLLVSVATNGAVVAGVSAFFAHRSQEKLERDRQNFQHLLEIQKTDFSKNIEVFKAELGFNAEIRRLAAARKFEVLCEICSKGRGALQKISQYISHRDRDKGPTSIITEVMASMQIVTETINANEYLFAEDVVSRLRQVMPKALQAQLRMQEHNTADEFIKQHKILSDCFVDFVKIAREELGFPGSTAKTDGELVAAKQSALLPPPIGPQLIVSVATVTAPPSTDA